MWKLKPHNNLVKYKINMSKPMTAGSPRGLTSLTDLDSHFHLLLENFHFSWSISSSYQTKKST